jgi:hypothetical protein
MKYPSFAVLFFMILSFLSTDSWATCLNGGAPMNPSSVYQINQDGTVLDTRTGLVWKRCLEGLSGEQCETGTATNLKWSAAFNYVKTHSFADKTDWRMPNIRELTTLSELCRTYPAINTEVFPNTPKDGNMLSSTPLAHNTWFTWKTSLAWGNPQDEYLELYGGYLRLVRSGAPYSSFKGDASAPLRVYTTFVSENFKDGTYHRGEAVKEWVFKNGPNPINGLTATHNNTNAFQLGVSSWSINIGNIEPHQEFKVSLPMSPRKGSVALPTLEFTFKDARNQTIPILNSKNNKFWLAIRTNRPPIFAKNHKTTINGAVGAELKLTLTAHDPDNDKLEFKSLAENGRILNGQWLGTFNSPGIQQVNIEVSDGLETAILPVTAVVYSPNGMADFFSDVAYSPMEESLYHNVHFLASKGIVVGTQTLQEQRLFEPERVVSQAEALKMLLLSAADIGLVDIDSSDEVPDHFISIDNLENLLSDYSWAASYAKTAERLGLIRSINGFQPGSPLTKEQLALWIAQLLQLEAPIAVLNARNLLDVYKFPDEQQFQSAEHYDAALVTALFGYHGVLSRTYAPKQSITRATLAMVASRMIRTPMLEGLVSADIQLAERFGELLPVVQHGQQVRISGVKNFTVTDIAISGRSVKGEQYSATNDFVNVGITFVDGAPLSPVRTVKDLAENPIILDTNKISMRTSAKYNLIVLLENTRSGVISAHYLPLAIDFADEDGDGSRDDLDAFPQDNRYSRDSNKNGVPDEVEELLTQLGIDGSKKATIKGIEQSYSLAYAIAFGLAYDKTESGIPLDVTAPVLLVPEPLLIQTIYSEGLSASHPQIVAYLSNVTATDNIDLNVTVSHNAPAHYAIGQTVITFSATDQAGNKSTATGTVTLELLMAKTPRKSKMLRILLMSKPDE